MNEKREDPKCSCGGVLKEPEEMDKIFFQLMDADVLICVDCKKEYEKSWMDGSIQDRGHHPTGCDGR